MGLLAELYGSGGVCWSNRGEGRAHSEPRQTGLRATHKAVSIFMRTSVEKLLQASLSMLYAVLAPQLVEGQSGSSHSTQGSGCQCTSTLALPHPPPTHMQTCTPTHMHTHTHAHMHTHTHAHMHTYTHAHAHTRTRTCTHTRTHTCTHTHTHAHACTPALPHTTYTRTSALVQIHTNTDACTHAHTCIWDMQDTTLG